jgi:hypothetical protein
MSATVIASRGRRRSTYQLLTPPNRFASRRFRRQPEDGRAGDRGHPSGRRVEIV